MNTQFIKQNVMSFWADGLIGQEDELENIHKGELDPPTDDEGPGEISEENDPDRELLKEDES